MSKHILRKHVDGFTIVSNNIIKALQNNLETLGFYLYLLSLPNDWEFYKSVLCSECSIGRDKLDKMLKILCKLGLVNVVQVRDAQGRFAHFDMAIYDKESINKQEEVEEKNEISTETEQCAPCTENHRAVETSNWCQTPIKETSTKEEKNKIKSSCASDDARAKESLFDSFWRSYPIKKNRKRSFEVWSKKNLDKIAEVIIGHVAKSCLQDSQWAQGFAPHPASYLTNERWEDEITQQKPKEVHQVHKSTEATQAKQEAQDYAKCAACQRPHLYCECGRPTEVTSVNRELIKQEIAKARAHLARKCGTAARSG